MVHSIFFLFLAADFLKLIGLGFASLLLPSAAGSLHLESGMQGRVIPSHVDLMDSPSLNGKKLREYWMDMVLPISEVVLGDQEPAFNRVWYRIREEGYVHSGNIQPVRTELQTAPQDLSSGEILGEVSVPFTDAFRGPGRNFHFVYRLYYETTHWIDALIKDPNGELWYRIIEDKWDKQIYAPAAHIRLVPDSELTSLSPDVPLIGKRIEVHTQDQVVIAYEWDRPIFMTKTATGARFSNGNFATPAGRHITFNKRPTRHMAAGNLAYNGYDLPGVPWISYITESGIAFHGTYWHNNFGKPRSHGCINLTSTAAKWIFRWTLPYVPPGEEFVYVDYGTAVDVMD